MRFVLFFAIAIFLFSQKSFACDCLKLQEEDAQRIVMQAYAIIRGKVVEQIDSSSFLVEPLNFYKTNLDINFPQAVVLKGDRHNIKCNEDSMVKGDVLDLILFRDSENPKLVTTGSICLFSMAEKIKELKKYPEAQIDARELINKKCAAKGGKMITPGTLINLRTCNLPTQDSGKKCRDNSQCEGSCRINTRNPISWLSFLPKIHSGMCTEDRLSQSKRCTPYVNNGSIVDPKCANE